MLKILVFLFSIFLFISCWNSQKEILQNNWINNIKSKYKTKLINDFSKEIFLEKSWVKKSKETIFITSNSYWTVWNIKFNEWDFIKEWEVFTKLKDNIKNYWINIEKSNNWIEKLQLQYDSTKLSYEKQINSLNNKIVNLKSNLDNLKKNKDKNIEDINNNLDNLDLNKKDNKSNLELLKIKNLLKEANLNLENQKKSNLQELNTIQKTLEWYYDTVNMWKYDMIQYIDDKLGVKKKNIDKKYKDYLWTKSTLFKTKVKNDFLNNILKGKLKIETKNLKDEDIKKYIKLLEENYKYQKDFLNEFEKLVREKSIININFKQEEVDNIVEKINSFQWKLERWNKDFIEFKNKALKFLDTYQKSIKVSLKKIDNVKKEREILEKNIDSNNKKWNITKDKLNINFEKNKKELENNIKLLENNLSMLKKDMNLKLKTILNSIEEWKISKKQAVLEYNKLTIKSPINWIIKDIFISKWQQVSVWTKLFTVINNWKPQIKIFFNKDELKYLKKWMEVYIENNWKELKAKLWSFSEIADNNLKYSWFVIFDNNSENFGELLKIKIPVKENIKLIPIDLVRLTSEKWIWKINILDDNKSKLIKIKIWKIIDNKIEVLECIDKNIDCNNLNLILE